jgi:hypothetical protein
MFSSSELASSLQCATVCSLLFSSIKPGNERDPSYDCSPKCLQLNFDYMHAQSALVVSCATRMRVCFGSMRSRGTVRCYCACCVWSLFHLRGRRVIQNVRGRFFMMELNCSCTCTAVRMLSGVLSATVLHALCVVSGVCTN